MEISGFEDGIRHSFNQDKRGKNDSQLSESQLYSVFYKSVKLAPKGTQWNFTSSIPVKQKTVPHQFETSIQFESFEIKLEKCSNKKFVLYFVKKLGTWIFCNEKREGNIFIPGLNKHVIIKPENNIVKKELIIQNNLENVANLLLVMRSNQENPLQKFIEIFGKSPSPNIEDFISSSPYTIL